MSVAVVVVNWNGAEDTLRCLASIAELSYRDFHVIVVDSASTDDSVARIRAARADVELLETQSNGGYAAAANVGVRRALDRRDKYVWLLNNDVSVEPSSLGLLVAAADGDDVRAAVASAVWNEPDGVADDNAFVVGPTQPAAREELTLPYPLPTFVRSGASQVPVRCTGCDASYHAADVLRGPSLLLRAAAVESVGGIDEGYFHYYEEVDLVVRLRQMGWEAGLACGARVTHWSGTSLSGASPAAQYYSLRNYLRFRQRVFGEHPLRVVVRDTTRGRRLVSVRHLAHLDGRPTVAGVRAILDACRGKFGPREFAARYREPLR